MTKKEAREFERIKRLLEAERERAEQLWKNHRETLYALVDAQLKLEAIENVLIGKEPGEE